MPKIHQFQRHNQGRSSRGVLRVLTGCLAALSLFFAISLSPSTAKAENLIKRPGAHNQYSFELEPQLAFAVGGYAHNYRGYYYGGGVGPGLRASIPFMHNGPIDSINNNIGISFGVNTFFYSNRYGGSPIGIALPVAFQWNFYFTDIISVLGEAGLVTTFVAARGYNDFFIDPLFQGGGRFQFGKVGVLVRVGYPMVSVGCNIQF